MPDRSVIHLLLHVLVPAVVALLFYRPRFASAFAILLSAMAIDLDHLLADPIYDPNRCSIGFHPLHAHALLPVYTALAFFPRTRLIGLGLTIHFFLDALDCGWMHLAR
jgi:hypothetical protein